MKEQLWESIKLMLWAWTMGRGETLPEGFREVLDKVEELLEEAAEGEKTQAGAADAPLRPETEEEKPEKPARREPKTGGQEPGPLAAALLDYMQSRELNASRVAGDLGCGSQTLRDILTGRRTPSRRVENAIRGYLETRGQEAPGAE